MTHQVGGGLPAADPANASTWLRPPSDLLVPSARSDMPPPVETRPQLLPVHELTWENFECLCLRLLKQDAELIHELSAGPAMQTTTPVVRS